MSNLRKNSKPIVAILTALLIISIAAPLLSFAAASGNANATLLTTTGPNGTLVQVAGSGFGVSESSSALAVTIDGSTAKATQTYIGTDYQLHTDSNGVLSGYFIIYGLSAGPHTVIISDSSSSAIAGTFTIKSPTVALTPSTGAAGTSVSISASGFPVVNPFIETGVTNVLVESKFAGSPIYSAPASLTAVSGATATIAGTSTGVVTGTPTMTVGAVSPLTSSVLQTTGTLAYTAVATPGAVTGTFPVVITATGLTITGTGTFTGSVAASSTSATVSVTIAITAITGTYKTTASPTTISSNQISTSTGAYSAVVGLPGITSGSSFTLTDLWGNVATTGFTVSTPTITLSPASGPVGTVVTATVSGFGPGATFTDAAHSVQVGNIAGSTSSATITPTAGVTVTEQGTAVFLFTIPAGAASTAAGASGAQTITVTDSKNNVATTTFTVTASGTITVGSASDDSHTTYVPQNTAANLYVNIKGFKPSSPVTITTTPGTPAEWLVPAATNPTTGTYASSVFTTDANGELVFKSTPATTPAATTPQYSITISDGTNTVSAVISVTTGSIIFVSSSTGTTGASGLGVEVSYIGKAVTAVNFDSTALPLRAGLADTTWPTAAIATAATDIIPTTTAGVHVFTATGTGSYNYVYYTVVAPTLKVVNPSSVAVGTTLTVVGSGFATTSGASIVIDAGASYSVTPSIAGTTMIATFSVPAYIAGSHTIILTDVSSVTGLPVNTAQSSFTIIPASIAVTPTSSALTATLSLALTGSGFASGNTLAVVFDAVTPAMTPTTGLSVVNTNGNIVLDSGFTVPAGGQTAGRHTITVTSSSGAVATASFTVQPSLNALSAVRPGAQVAIGGKGFAANSVETVSVNGTQVSWYKTPAAPVVDTTTADYTTDPSGNLLASTAFIIIPATTAPGTLVITITDAAGNTASTNLSVLASPAITLGAPQIVAGAPVAFGPTITGTGFTPRTSGSITAQLLSGSTVVVPSTSVTLSTTSLGASYSVSSTGTFPYDIFPVTEKIALPANVPAGDYTLVLTIGTGAAAESASAAITVMNAPTITAPSAAVSATNVTISVTGMTAISTATLNGINLISSTTFGSQTISAKGANAYTATTWFIVPSTLFAGSYLLIVTDGNTGLSAQTAISVTPTITLGATTGSKGALISVPMATATGFAANSRVTATFNGVAITLTDSVGTAITATTDANGKLTANAYFSVPVTATATNTVVLTDLAGNSASAAFNVTIPTITIVGTGSAGSTIQVIGNGFTASSPMVIQIANQVVVTVPAALTANAGGAFITYVTVPTGLSGNVTVTATDSSNNVATAFLETSSTGVGTPNQTTMTSTAKTTTPSGTPSTTFTAGSSAQASFSLQSTGGSRDVVVAVTWQQGAKVYGMSSFQTTMDATARTATFQQLIPAGATGTWTATLQVFASDGTTPLAVTTLTFTVA